MKNVDWNNVEDVDLRPIPGGYVCRITSVEDVEEKEYLKISFDFAAGPFQGYYTRSAERFGNWPSAGTFIRSYKDSALSFFKGFVTALEKSNPGFRWTSQTNQNPSSIRGLLFGAVLGEEEYEWRGEVKTKLSLAQACSIQRIEDGGFKVPEKKRLNGGYYAQPSAPGGYASLEEDDGELPF